MKTFKHFIVEAEGEWWITDGEYPDRAPWKGKLNLFGAYSKVHGTVGDKALTSLATAKKHWKTYKNKGDDVYIVQLKNGGEGHVVWPPEAEGKVFPRRKS